MMSPTILTSPSGRLTLVPPDPTDDADFLKLRTHPSVRQYLRFLPEHLTMDDIRQLRETRDNDPTMMNLHIHLNTSEKKVIFAGSTGYRQFSDEFRSCEVGILIVPEMHGSGLATETLYTFLKWLFEDRKLHRVTFETDSANLPMRRWLEEHAEATLEAQRRECWRNSDGSYSDVTGYSILEWEWTGNVKSRLETKLGVECN